MIEAAPPAAGALPPPRGRIVTFYSYKGGTGRSMALANVAWMLALTGNRVLVIDWDLEAPGVHRYFHPFLEDKELCETVGLLDMVEDLAVHAATSAAPLPSERVDIIDYIEPLEWPRRAAGELSWKRFGPRARIDFMPAGRQGPAYSRKLNGFNWIDFYERLGGRQLLEAARRQMRSIYDYVLIDSRTGVSDTSGICTVEMPDTLVVCFTLNDQSIKGAAAVAESVREQWARLGDAPSEEARGSGSRVELPRRMFFVPTRVEIGSERDKREIALELAQRTFGPYLNGLSPELRRRYWGEVQVPYIAYYAFEEIPAVFGDNAYDQLSLSTRFKAIVRLITDSPAAELPALAGDPAAAEQIRHEIVGWYLRHGPYGQIDGARLAQERAELAKQRAELAEMTGPRGFSTAAEQRAPREARHRAARTKLAALLILVGLFVINWMETTLESSLRKRYHLGTALEQPLGEAAQWFERGLSFEQHDVTNGLAVYGFSTVYFFIFPLIALTTVLVAYRQREPGLLLLLAVAAAIDYLLTLPFYIFFPVPERWAYPDSGAALLSDRWSSSLIQAFRPFSGLNNCFPSFHVSITVVLVACLYRSGSRVRALSIPLGLAVVLSTFALGIQWLSNIVAGAGCGLASYAIAERLLPRIEAMVASPWWRPRRRPVAPPSVLAPGRGS